MVKAFLILPPHVPDLILNHFEMLSNKLIKINFIIGDFFMIKNNFLCGSGSLSKGFTSFSKLRNDLIKLPGIQLRFKERKKPSGRKTKYFLSFHDHKYISSLQRVNDSVEIYSFDYDEKLYLLEIKDNQVLICYQ